MVVCPVCQQKQIGKIGVNQFYCWTCFIELSIDKGRIHFNEIDEDGSLCSLDDVIDYH